MQKPREYFAKPIWELLDIEMVFFMIGDRQWVLYKSNKDNAFVEIERYNFTPHCKNG